MSRRELGIYVHIPFCIRKCAYCDFLSFPASASVQREYFKALREEIAGFETASEYEAVSVYFGGGTPSSVPEGEVVKTLEVIRRTFRLSEDAEISIECNPGTTNREKLSAYHRAGFNRLSMGLQSGDEALLKKLGRIHTWEEFRREYGAAREEGFENISIDLMYDLPGQTIASWEDTLKKAAGLWPEHVSAYSLIIEEGTLFWDLYHEDDEKKKRGEKPLFLPDEDAEEYMLESLRSTLREIGMYRYEISNYALPGRESRHNTGYWLRREYAGFGLGASGQTGKMRYRNTTSLPAYLKAAAGIGAGCGETAEDKKVFLREGKEACLCEGKDAFLREEETLLSREDEIAETMILGLRMTCGVDLERFEKIFHARAEDLFPEEIGEFLRAGLLERDGRFLRLTDRGLDVSNLVMSAFV